MKGHEKFYTALYWTVVGFVIWKLFTWEVPGELVIFTWIFSILAIPVAFTMWEIITEKRPHLGLSSLLNVAITGINKLLDKIFD